MTHRVAAIGYYRGRGLAGPAGILVLMLRASFTALLPGLLICACSLTDRQRPRDDDRLVIVFTSRTGRLSSGSPTLAAFEQELERSSYSRDRAVRLEFRYADAEIGPAAAAAADLVKLSPYAIIAGGTTHAVAAANVTSEIPIIYMGGDATAQGLTTSAERPSRNVTGVTARDWAARPIRVLKQIVPGLEHVYVLTDPTYLVVPTVLRQTESAAAQNGLRSTTIELRDLKEFAELQSLPLSTGANALIILHSPKLGMNAKRILQAAHERRLPVAAPYTGYAELGALLACQADTEYWSRRVAQYLDAILRGTKPASLPIERADKTVLTINLNAARDLGISVPEDVLRATDRIIR